MALDLDLYRPNVGVVLFNPQGLAWMGRRNVAADYKGQEAASATEWLWQFPQGGVDDGEALDVAARRELAEETGVTSVEYLARTSEWAHYDFPPELAARGKWRGQKQIWYAFRFLGEESEIRLDQHEQIEFDAWRWAKLAEAPDLIVPFKRDAYLKVVDAFSAFAV